MSGALAYLRTEWRLMILLVAVGVPAAMAEGAGLLLVGSAAVSVASKEDQETSLPFGVNLDLDVRALLLVAAVLVVTAGALRVFGAFIRARAIASREADLRQSLADAYVHADYPTQRDFSSGEILDLSSTAIVRVGAGLNAGAQVVLATTSLLVFVLGALLVHPLVGVLLVGLGGGLVSGLRPLTRSLRSTAARHATASIQQAETLAEAVSVSRDAALFGAESAVLTSLRSHFDDSADHRRRGLALATSAPAVYQAAGLLLIIATVAILASSAGEDLGEIGGAALLMLRSLAYGQQLQVGINGVAESLEYSGRVDGAVDRLGVRSLQSGSDRFLWPNELLLEQVSYEYPDAESDEFAVDRLSISFGPHETVGIVGPSGCGKSTLAEIILRLRDPSAGQVRLGSIESSCVRLAEWRQAIALVPQMTVLLADSIAENIRFYRDTVDMNDVVNAAKAAGIHDTITSLPEQYETRIGGTERQLSGGQAQRLGIARALAGGPVAIVLDEPTSSLDKDATQTIVDTLARVRGQKLVIIIAHGGATIGACDRIAVLDKGRLVDLGTPAEVRSRNTYVSALLSGGGD